MGLLLNLGETLLGQAIAGGLAYDALRLGVAKLRRVPKFLDIRGAKACINQHSHGGLLKLRALWMVRSQFWDGLHYDLVLLGGPRFKLAGPLLRRSTGSLVRVALFMLLNRLELAFYAADGGIQLIPPCAPRGGSC